LFLVLCAALSFFGCGDDSPAVGTGAPLSSLSEAPTAEELYDAFEASAISVSFNFSKLGSKSAQRLPVAKPNAQLMSEEESTPCPNGGSIDSTFQVSAQSAESGPSDFR
jgi:hypothetical protein